MAIGAPSYNVLIEMDFEGKIIQSIHVSFKILNFKLEITYKLQV